jgi:glycine betaine catabolism B
MLHLKPIDRWLDTITMYKLVLYGLGLLAGFATLFSFLGLLAYSGLAMMVSLLTVSLACVFINTLLARLYGVVTNSESSLITALILFFLFSPNLTVSGLTTLVLASVIAMSAKYALAIRDRHIFNPAATAAVVLGFIPATAATWWVATAWLLPITLVLGFLIARKIKREAMVLTFLSIATLGIVYMSTQFGLSFSQALVSAFTSWPIIFMGTIMLTEPLTSPPRQRTQIIYAAIVGILMVSRLHLGPLFFTPEVALLIGNIFAYTVSSRERLTLKLKDKRQLATDTYEFAFTSNYPVKHVPGQYAEWTLDHAHVDIRGNRRYFTIASSPTESELLLGVRIIDNGSSFKKALNALKPGDSMYAGQISGDFVLPKNPQTKCLFIAGGIGITPFRSMLAYLRDQQEKRDIILLYSVKQPGDVAYTELLKEAESLGVKVIITASEADKLPADWQGETGFVNEALIQKHVPDVRERDVYISGPPGMVQGLSGTVKKLGVARKQLHTDYFPGFG